MKACEALDSERTVLGRRLTEDGRR